MRETRSRPLQQLSNRRFLGELGITVACRSTRIGLGQDDARYAGTCLQNHVETQPRLAPGRAVPFDDIDGAVRHPGKQPGVGHGQYRGAVQHDQIIPVAQLLKQGAELRLFKEFSGIVGVGAMGDEVEPAQLIDLNRLIGARPLLDEIGQTDVIVA